VDEFLVPDPARYRNLVEFVAARRGRKVMAPVGLNVLHHVRVEDPIDPTRPVLGQRRFVKFVPRMCKPCIKRVPADWRKGSHGIAVPFEVDPELFMFHLKFYDRDALRVTAGLRNELVAVDGRGSKSSWAKGGDEIASMFVRFAGREAAVDVPELDPAALGLSSVVRAGEDETYVTRLPVQLTAMRQQPLLRIPERFMGIL